MVPLTTALSSTVISGYVDVAAQYDAGNYGPSQAFPRERLATSRDSTTRLTISR
jgi:hypothetical protein